MGDIWEQSRTGKIHQRATHNLNWKWESWRVGRKWIFIKFLHMLTILSILFTYFTQPNYSNTYCMEMCWWQSIKFLPQHCKMRTQSLRKVKKFVQSHMTSCWQNLVSTCGPAFSLCYFHYIFMFFPRDTEKGILWVDMP